MQQPTFQRDPIRRQLATARPYGDHGAAVAPAPVRGTPRMTGPAVGALVAGEEGVPRIVLSGAVVSAAAVAAAALALLS